MTNDLETHPHRLDLMNEPRHIKEVMIRLLEAQILVATIEIDDLMNKKAPWDEIERLMDNRDELTTLLNNLKSDQQNDKII